MDQIRVQCDSRGDMKITYFIAVSSVLLGSDRESVHNKPDLSMTIRKMAAIIRALKKIVRGEGNSSQDH